MIAGDMPLLRHETLELLTRTHQSQNSAVTLATAVLEDPSGYGRIVRDELRQPSGHRRRERLHRPQQKKIKEINPSYYCFRQEAVVRGSRPGSPRQREGRAVHDRRAAAS
jgi:bifunctional UDP-N-acetylglucosamine pyrophosphorylase / glucosamine-1-phosphate N-acetyltransferase